ncbi:MAG TPA: aspartate carbamoyltransferase catalytic subunit [Myxococcota bacterium]|nr:aspartate carbamoyltransferase catalytic subunit [Myxococcota bacterium]
MGGRHLLGTGELSAAQIHAILDTATGFRDISRRVIKKVPSLRGRTVLNVFYEASTRTRVSFELAAKRLSADAINISASGSSAAKGESLLDTAQTLDAMQADAVVLRHGASGAAKFVSERVAARVINAGDGQHEHPTQALLDLLTMRTRFGKLEGLEVAIVGDISHSRVARSNLLALRTVGANVRVAGPRTLLPRGLTEAYTCTLCDSVDQAIEGAHVVMALRLQRERMLRGLLPTLREYAIEYGVSARRLQRARPEAILMHPGPVNRGVELSPDVVDGPRSVILDQVENGVAVRAAILYLILGGEAS